MPVDGRQRYGRRRHLHERARHLTDVADGGSYMYGPTTTVYVGTRIGTQTATPTVAPALVAPPRS